MGLSVGELFVSLGFDVDDAKLKDFNTALNSTFNDMLKLAGISASVAGFAHIMNGASEAAVRLRNMNAELNISSQLAQKWAAVVHQVNPLITIEAAQETYSRLQKTLIDISQGKGPSGTFARLAGTNVAGMSPDEVLERISSNRERFLKENGPNAAALHSQLMDQAFGGAGWERAMMLSKEMRDEMGDRMVVEEKNLQKLDVLADKMAVLGELWHKLIMDTAASLAPAVSGFVDSVNKGGVKGGLAWVGERSWIESVGSAVGEWLSGSHTAVPAVVDSIGKHTPLGAYPKSVGSVAMMSEKIMEARRYFQAQGWTAEQSAGMVDRLVKESNLDPRAIGDGGQASGIAQWHPDRQANFKNWAGKSINDATFQEQLAFVQYELTKGTERKAGDMLRRTSLRDESYASFTNNYERPAKPVVNQTNSIVIHSTAPAAELAAEIERRMQAHWNSAYTVTQIGANY